MASFYTRFLNIRFWVSSCMVYNPFTDLSSSFTIVVTATLFLWAFIVIYNIMVVFHSCFIFDLKTCTKFSTGKCYAQFFIVGSNFSVKSTLHFYLDRIWKLSGVSQVYPIHYLRKIDSRHQYYCCYY